MANFNLTVKRQLAEGCRFSWQVGGMGDVVTALARAVQDEGHEVSVIIPKYDCLDYAEVSPFSSVWTDFTHAVFTLCSVHAMRGALAWLNSLHGLP